MLPRDVIKAARPRPPMAKDPLHSLLHEETGRLKDKGLRRNLFESTILVAEMLKTSLGPMGMSKLISDNLGIVTITKEAWRIFKEVEAQHPGAKILAELSRAMRSEVGDGATSAVVLAGALVKEAGILIERGLHPAVVLSGYRRAYLKSLEVLREIAIGIPPLDRPALMQVAGTSLGARLVLGSPDRLSEVTVDAALQVTERFDSTYRVDVDRVKIDKKENGTVNETFLVRRGMALDKQLVNRQMPRTVRDARIALLNVRMQLKKPLEMHSSVQSTLVMDSPEKVRLFMEEGRTVVTKMVDRLLEVGANVVINQRQIGTIAQQYMVRTGIMGVQRVREDEMKHLADVVGGTVVSDIDGMTPMDLGGAELVEERAMEEPLPNWIFIEGGRMSRGIGIMVRGATRAAVNETSRALECALLVVKNTIEHPSIVAGGGAAEAEVARRLEDWSYETPGVEQLSIQAFARALREIPLALAANAGMDVIDTQADLTAAHANGGLWTGIDVNRRSLTDMYRLGILEPLKVKEQLLKSSHEGAAMLIRIDGLIAAKKEKEIEASDMIDPRPPAMRAGTPLRSPPPRVES